MNNNPSILWAQDRTHLLITIEINNFKNQDITFDSDNINLMGLSDNREYNILIDLHSNIVGEGSSWSIKKNKVELKVEKRKNIYWQKLTKNKQNNIRIDWQKWQDEEEEEEEEEILDDFSNFKKQLPEDFLNKNFEDMLPNDLDDLDDEESEESEDFEVEELDNEDEDLEIESDNDGDVDTDENAENILEADNYTKKGGLEVLDSEELNLE